MPNTSIKIAAAFKPLFLDPYENYAVGSGRVSGKSKTAYILAGVYSATKPKEDIIIARASYGSIADSSYTEMEEVISDIPQFSGQFIFRKSPLRIIRKGGGTNIYFIGANGSIDRTKGIKTKHPVGLVVIEEAQELKDKEHLDQLIASLRRRFGTDCKVVVCFNPPSIKAHWINIWYQQLQADLDWCCLHPSWEDIAEFLSDREIKEIIKCKLENRAYYDYMYGGIATGGEGLVYPMFREDLHVIPYEKRQVSKSLQDFRIVGVIIGCDGAVTRDCTAFVPRLIMSNGQSVAAKIFYHNPKTMGQKGSFPLVENEGMRWFRDLINENGLDNRNDYRTNIPMVFVVDSAATELIQALRYYFGNRADVVAIKKGTILQMVDVNQSAIGKNVCMVYDYGGYYDYTNNKWVSCENLLKYQYESLIWNEKQTGYDPIVPNDVSDADTYGVYFYYRQTENIVWLQDVVNHRKDYYNTRENVV